MRELEASESPEQSHWLERAGTPQVLLWAGTCMCTHVHAHMPILASEGSNTHLQSPAECWRGLEMRTGCTVSGNL